MPPTNPASDALPSSAAAPVVFQEKRSSPRVPFKGRAQALIFPPLETAAVSDLQDAEIVTSDLSRSGVSLLYRRQLTRGQRLLLLLHDTSRMVEVCWCCRVWDDLFVAGCQFVDVAGPSGAEQLLNAVDAAISEEVVWLDAGSATSVAAAPAAEPRGA